MVPISSTVSFYSHGGRNFRNGNAAGFYRFPKDSTRVVHAVYPDGFSPRIGTEIQDDAVTVGIRGLRNNWNIDFSNTNGTNSLDFNVLNSNNASFGPSSPRSFYSGGYLYNQNTTNFDAYRNFRWFNGVNLAFGVEMRLENFQINAGDEESYATGDQDTLLVGGQVRINESGAQVFPGFQPSNELNEFRTNNAWYIDIESRLSEKLFLGTAARYETYSDFGDQGTWKLSSRYKILNNFSVNAGLSTGFRAPSLHQVHFNSTSTQFFANNTANRVATLDNEEAIIVFGIDQLQPELSDHISAGLAAKIGNKLSVTLDYYNIRIQDRIVLSGRFQEGFEEQLEFLGVDEAQFFVNAIDTRTNGADLVVNYKEQIGNGEFYSLTALNVTETKVVGDVKSSEALQGQEDKLFNREEVSRIEQNQPNFKFINQSSYKFNRFTFNLNNTVFGRVKYVHPSDGDFNNWVENEFTGQVETRDQVFKPKLVTDLLIAYQFNDYVKLTVGGHNIFDVYPDEHTHSANTSSGRFVYSRRVQQFGVKGAFYFAKLSLSL
jgi:iron complex outermembrane receptor protein